jgi:hypothetical protein
MMTSGFLCTAHSAPARRASRFLAGTACGDAERPAPTAPLAGTYAAASMLRQQDGASDELVDLGARFDLTLLGDSTLTGRVMFPANLLSSRESDPIEQVLVGRWSLHGNAIRLRLEQPVLGNQPTLGEDEQGLVGTLVVPDLVDGTMWIKLLLVRAAP